MAEGGLPRVLFVDDEPELLASLRLGLRRRFQVGLAGSGTEALDACDQAAKAGVPFEAVVSDMRMPGMSGAELLRELRRRYPDVPRLLLSGQADVDSAIAAVNEAKIFRFLTKPCPPETLAEAIDDALEQARLARAEKELLNRTLKGMVGLLTDVLGLVSVAAYARTQRIETIVTSLSAAVGRPVPWDLALAAKLSQLGFVVMHEPGDDQLDAHHVELAVDLLVNIPRMESVAHAVAHQLDEAPVGGGGDWTAWARKDANAEILRVAVRFDTLTAAGASLEEAYQAIAATSAPPPRMLLDALAGLRIDWASLVEARVTARELATGMHLASDVMAANGLKLASAGTVLTSAHVGRIRSFASRVGVGEPITVLVPEATMAKLEPRPVRA